VEKEGELQVANSMFSLAGILEVVWHIVGCGLAIVLWAAWAWELVVNWQRAKAMRNPQDSASKGTLRT
jgi:hypothetical protein